ncbi:winged helix DNA-binding protein [Clostridioides difficile]|uniref:winged helix DNA-binding protein n=1 Tax=Clostridioides difficile TaxID=1496 RepID=UPI001EEE9265|nr:winged helix DNA-binding protein [Clostridioides difficile]
MEKNGYVERKPSENDKRVMIVHLTEKGKQVQQPKTDYQNIFGWSHMSKSSFTHSH